VLQQDGWQLHWYGERNSKGQTMSSLVICDYSHVDVTPISFSVRYADYHSFIEFPSSYRFFQNIGLIEFFLLRINRLISNDVDGK